MTTTYGIRVLQDRREQDVAAIRQAVAQELITLGLHRSVAVVVTEARSAPTIPYVCMFLGDAAHHAMSAPLAEEIEYELKQGCTIFPVVSDLRQFAEQVPRGLSYANGVQWDDDASLQRMIRTLLEELGIEDRQRRVFISHRRDDGLGAAEQLHDRLTHFGFQPFIDRFAVRKGASVQAEIADALEDHAFLLLLETPLAHTSEWVYDEVDYALSHTMGVLIVRWPGDVPAVPGSAGLPRLQISEAELVLDEHNFEVFTDAGLDNLVARIEEGHAFGLVRRRKMLVKSIEEAALAAPSVDSCVSLRDWRLLVGTQDGRMVVGTTPRLPTAADLQAVDEASTAVGAERPGLLVHSARRVPKVLGDHLDWVSQGRGMGMIPENAIGGWWSNGG